jgi:hypothetical protein
MQLTNRRFWVDLIDVERMSNRMVNVFVRDSVPSGAGVDTKVTHIIIVIQNCTAGRFNAFRVPPLPNFPSNG